MKLTPDTVTYKNLTLDAYKGALKETTNQLVRAQDADNKTMIDIWEAEVARVSNVIYNWDFLARAEG